MVIVNLIKLTEKISYWIYNITMESKQAPVASMHIHTHREMGRMAGKEGGSSKFKCSWRALVLVFEKPPGWFWCAAKVKYLSTNVHKLQPSSIHSINLCFLNPQSQSESIFTEEFPPKENPWEGCHSYPVFILPALLVTKHICIYVWDFLSLC